MPQYKKKRTQFKLAEISNTKHSPESNSFSEPGSAEQNWSIISKNDNRLFCSFLSIFYDGKIFSGTEPFTEPLGLQSPEW